VTPFTAGKERITNSPTASDGGCMTDERETLQQIVALLPPNIQTTFDMLTSIMISMTAVVQLRPSAEDRLAALTVLYEAAKKLEEFVFAQGVEPPTIQ
jgi:hypothetical protein